VAIQDRKRTAGRQLLVGFQGLTAEQELTSLIRDYAIGGIVLFKRNIAGPEQLQSLLNEAQRCALETLKRPLWVAIDQEGGPVQRLAPPYTKLPAARELAEQGEPAVIHWTGIAARELQESGIHINFAPVLDVISGAEPHFLGARSLGSDAREVAHLGRLWIRTLQQGGGSATAKHFPGLGRAELDPHHFAPVIRWAGDQAREWDLLPFKAAIQEGVQGIMTSHALYPSLDSEWPATLSPQVNARLLREQLGFEGVLFSDDLDMAAICQCYSWADIARQGLLSGIDCFLLCQHSDNIEPFYLALTDTIRTDQSLAALHHASLGRIDRLARQHGMLG
jgi:beta-N-acetylhexosaminidase